jgi:pimeloyl-ACP methyl ester carboxylesterase
MTSLDFGLDVSELQFLDLHGYRMAYREWGAPRSKPILLIHGITSSSLTWIRVAPRLASRWHVFAVDLKGHGDSDQPARGYRLSDQADEVAEMCTVLELDDVAIVGHSWGGAIAVLLATRTGSRVKRLVLEDPAVGRRNQSPAPTSARREAAQRYIASVGLTREQAEAMARPNLADGWTEADVAGKIDAAMKGSPAAVEAVFRENGDWEVLDQLADLRCPTLLVRAEVSRGGIVGQEAVELAKANSQVRVVTVPQADHNIHRGRYDAFMALVEPFLGGTELT